MPIFSVLQAVFSRRCVTSSELEESRLRHSKVAVTSIGAKELLKR